MEEVRAAGERGARNGVPSCAAGYGREHRREADPHERGGPVGHTGKGKRELATAALVELSASNYHVAELVLYCCCRTGSSQAILAARSLGGSLHPHGLLLLLP